MYFKMYFKFSTFADMYTIHIKILQQASTFTTQRHVAFTLHDECKLFYENAAWKWKVTKGTLPKYSLPN